jgi:energy-coupling factor transporter ATP-binding protein EcfA2
MTSLARPDLVAKTSSFELLEYLRAAIGAGASVGVCGFAGSGKSTTLATLASMTHGRGLTLALPEDPLGVTERESELGDEVSDVTSFSGELLVVDDLVTDEAWHALGASTVPQVMATFPACTGPAAALERLGPAGGRRFDLFVTLGTYHSRGIEDVSTSNPDSSLWAPPEKSLLEHPGPFLVAQPTLGGVPLTRLDERARSLAARHLEPFVLVRGPRLVARVPKTSLEWLPDWPACPDPGLRDGEADALAASLAEDPIRLAPLLDRVRRVVLESRLAGAALEAALVLVDSWSGDLDDLVNAAPEL